MIQVDFGKVCHHYGPENSTSSRIKIGCNDFPRMFSVHFARFEDRQLFTETTHTQLKNFSRCSFLRMQDGFESLELRCKPTSNTKRTLTKQQKPQIYDREILFVCYKAGSRSTRKKHFPDRFSLDWLIQDPKGIAKYKLQIQHSRLPEKTSLSTNTTAIFHAYETHDRYADLVTRLGT